MVPEDPSKPEPPFSVEAIVGTPDASGGYPNPWGIHARVAALLTEIANTFLCEIRVSSSPIASESTEPQPDFDGKSVLGWIALAAITGSKIIISTRGPDEETAAHLLKAAVQAETREEIMELFDTHCRKNLGLPPRHGKPNHSSER